MDLSRLSFIDLETTGASPTADRIIEIGILRVENGQLVKTYQSLINPEIHLPLEKSARFIVDKWCLIQEDNETLFDLDIYKILKRWLANPKNLKSVKALNGYDTPSRYELHCPSAFSTA